MKILMMINILIWSIMVNINCKHEPCIDPSQVFNQKAWDKYTQAASNGDTSVYFGSQECLGTGQYVHVNKYDYSDPCFNPNNINQIAYVRHENNVSPYINEIWTFDINTGDRKLLTNIHLGNLQWSKNNWLLFMARNNMLYKIKADGDSLTQLTFDGEYNFDASWNGEGDKFVYRKTVGGTGYCIIADKDGVALDTIEALLNGDSFSWQGSTITLPYGYYPNRGVAIYDLTSSKLEHRILSPNDQNGIHTAILKNGIIYWTKFGVGSNKLWAFLKNYLSNSTTSEIAKGFVNRQYRHFDISLDSKKILIERRDLSQISVCRIAERNYLYIMNTDGTDEKRINIPE